MRAYPTPDSCLTHLFPSLQLGTGKTAGWLVGWLVSRVCRASRVRPRGAEGRQARLCAHGRRAAYARQERRGSTECIIQRRSAIHVDSVPSCKLDSARTRPRVHGRGRLVV